MKPRILVVDDDLFFRQMLKQWLEKEGYESVLAESLEEGFMGIATEPLPDAVLLDIHLGEKSGLTLVHWARKQRHLAHLPIVALTGDDTLKDRKRSHDAGCDAHFTKPIDFHALRKYLVSLGVFSTT
ncbi:MAG: response regulator [Acidobacteriia bacterium]|nr:response regulator [Terriglobia bacterium]